MNKTAPPKAMCTKVFCGFSLTADLNTISFKNHLQIRKNGAVLIDMHLQKCLTFGVHIRLVSPIYEVYILLSPIITAKAIG